MPKCKTCKDERWVCEGHKDRPWNDGNGCCGAPGAPCPKCNKVGPGEVPAMPPGFTEV